MPCRLKSAPIVSKVEPPRDVRPLQLLAGRHSVMTFGPSSLILPMTLVAIVMSPVTVEHAVNWSASA